MPCILVSTNQSLSVEKQEVLKARFGKAIELIPGKTQRWLMCVFYPACNMYFQGEKKDLAFIEVGIYGQPQKDDLDRLTEELMQIVGSELNIVQKDIYIKYSTTPYWGWNGKNF